MAFYFLHKMGSKHPENEKDFEYLVSVATEPESPRSSFKIPIEHGEFCGHKLNSEIKWNVEDDLIDVETKHTSEIFVQFKKVYDSPSNITIWKRIDE